MTVLELPDSKREQAEPAAVLDLDGLGPGELAEGHLPLLLPPQPLDLAGTPLGLRPLAGLLLCLALLDDALAHGIEHPAHLGREAQVEEIVGVLLEEERELALGVRPPVHEHVGGAEVLPRLEDERRVGQRRGLVADQGLEPPDRVAVVRLAVGRPGIVEFVIALRLGRRGGREQDDEEKSRGQGTFQGALPEASNSTSGTVVVWPAESLTTPVYA